MDMGGKGVGVIGETAGAEEKTGKTPPAKVQKTVHRGSKEISDVLTKSSKGPNIPGFIVPRMKVSETKTDVKNFQNRKNDFSEDSVQGIINAVKSGKFLIHIFDPIRIRRGKGGSPYVLIGHSRREAFKRLSTDPLKDDKDVKNFVKKNGYDFSMIPYFEIPKNVSFEEAKLIALTSNCLATHESDMERAYFYRQMRGLGVKNGEYLNMIKIYEKNNWKTIDSYSYLNPDGYVASIVENLKPGKHTPAQKKIAYWIGIAMKNWPILREIHEKEMREWLREEGIYLDKGKKGSSKSDKHISNYEEFSDVIGSHIEKLKITENFDGNVLLNLKNVRSLTYSEKLFIETLRMFQREEADARAQLGHHVRNVNKKILNKKVDQVDLFTNPNLIDEEFDDTIIQLHFFDHERIENHIKEVTDTVKNNEDYKRVKNQLIQVCIKLKSKVMAHLSKKGDYIKAGTTELGLYDPPV